MNNDTKTNEVKPLPCPFCGDVGHVTESDEMFYVQCLNPTCFCSLGEAYDRDAMPDHQFKSKEQALVAWNRRTVLPSSDNLKEELSLSVELREGVEKECESEIKKLEAKLTVAKEALEKWWFLWDKDFIDYDRSDTTLFHHACKMMENLVPLTQEALASDNPSHKQKDWK